MKKITSLVMLLMFVCASAFAQLPELTGYAVQQGEMAATMTPDTQWYLVWNKRVHTTEGGGYFQDMGVNVNAIMSEGVNVVQDGMDARDAAKFLVRFISNGNDEQGNPQYLLQFGTGNYMKAVSLTENKAVQTTDNVENATPWNVYNINGTEYHFALNIAPMGKRLDENGSGATIATWGDGVLTETGGNNDFTFYAIDLVEATDLDLALGRLSAVYNEYQDSHPSPDADLIGDGYGQYSQAAVDAYEAALEYASSIIDIDGEGLTVEQIDAAAQAIKDAWDALVASRKPFAIAVTPGYYVIKNTVDFTETTTETDEATGEEVTLTKHMAKAIFENKGTAQWKTFEPKADFLFKVEASEKTNQYKVINMLNGLTFNPIATSSAATMSATDSLMVFDWAANTTVFANELDEVATKEVTAVNIRLAAQAERGDKYAHAGGHGGGTGKNGNIVGWSTGGATDWYLDPIDEATALAWIEAASPVKVITAMVDSVNVIKAAFPGQKAIAEDNQVSLDMEHGLITDASQFSSPYSQNDLGNADGQDLSSGCLIDGNASTYWHSYWGGGDVVNGTHYLQIRDIDTSIDGVAFKMVRRTCQNDHVTQMTVYGFNADDESLTKDNGELLATLNFPNPVSGATINSEIFRTNGYGILRIYAEATSNNRGYWHAAEIQLYPAKIATAEHTQAEVRADLIAAVEAAITTWNEAGYSIETVTDPNDAAFVAAYNAVVNAYAAWTAVYADPAPLRTAIDKANAFAEMIVTGDNPGQWPEGAGADAINTAVTAAKAYINAGTYTPATMAAEVEKVQAAQAQVAGAAIQVVPGKWYTIRFATEEEYEEHNWDKSGAVSEAQGDLYENYVVPALDEAPEVEGAPRTHTIVRNSELYKGQELRFSEDTSNGNDEEAAFRFVKIGDDMALQHSSGWYVAQNGTLSDAPALMSTEAIGYGKSLIKVRQMDGQDINAGGTPSYLHAQVAGHKLVAWAATAIDSRSALYIEEADAQTIAGCKEQVQPGQRKFTVSPVGVTYGSDVQLYTFDGYEKTTDGIKVAFTETDKAEAGKAVLMVVAGEYPAEPTAETKIAVDLTLGNELAAVPDSTQALVGTYKYQWVAEADTTHTVTIFQNKMQMATGKDNTDCARDISAYTGAIDLNLAQEIATAGKDLVIEITGNVETAIEEVVAKAINTNGKIYTIDGKYVGNGNIGTARNMGSGIYIINGVKIYVK